MNISEKYHSNCHKEKGECECCYQTVTISIHVPKQISPKIRVSSDICGHTYSRCSCGEKQEPCCHKCGHTYSRCSCGEKQEPCCHKCGHTYSRCSCGEKQEPCCHKCGHTYSRCSCEGPVIDARLDRY
jgi:hypothetical protein